MKEQDVIHQFRVEMLDALPDIVTVRTRGGDNSGKPPLCLLEWDATRLGENGSSPYAGTAYDETTGEVTGRELHRYYQMDMDVAIRSYDEGNRDKLLSDVMDAFLLYEDDASTFHNDTTEWEVGDPSPRSNPVVEPDWYEGGLTIRFKYVSRVQRELDALTDVQTSVDAGE